MNRLCLPRGCVHAPVERSLAAQLAPADFRRVMQPEAFSPTIWRGICAIYARHWLENRDRWPVASLFAYQLGVLAAGQHQTFSNKDIYAAAQTGTSYLVSGIATKLLVKAWGGGGGGAENKNASGTAVGGDGGGAGYAYGEIGVIPGETLTRYVGGGGAIGGTSDGGAGG
ncbi:MAG: hypothetical protein JNN33_07700, partial [Rhodospirillaceae bacterium]|nr:hypothetical protein [Rhodospirillaceae bacterium]